MVKKPDDEKLNGEKPVAKQRDEKSDNKKSDKNELAQKNDAHSNSSSKPSPLKPSIAKTKQKDPSKQLSQKEKEGDDSPKGAAKKPGSKAEHTKTSQAQNPLHDRVNNRRNQKAKRIVNLFTIIILLLIVGAIYMYQKGYISNFHPSANTHSSKQSPIGTSVIEDTFSSTDSETTIESQGQFSNRNQNSVDSENLKNLPSLGKNRSSDETTNSPKPSIDDLTNTMGSSKMRDELVAQGKRIDVLESRLKDLQKTIVNHSESLNKFEPHNKANSENNQLIQRAKFLTILALQDLIQKINRGFPFEKELRDLQQSVETYKSLLQSLDVQSLNPKNDVKGSDVTKLSQADFNQAFEAIGQFSQIGVPSLDYLIAHYKPIGKTRQKHQLLLNAVSFWDRVILFLNQLITITPSKDQQGKRQLSPDISKDITLLRQGRVADVADKILNREHHLNNENQKTKIKISPEESLWLTHAVAYVDSHKALEVIKKMLTDM